MESIGYVEYLSQCIDNRDSEKINEFFRVPDAEYFRLRDAVFARISAVPWRTENGVDILEIPDL